MPVEPKPVLFPVRCRRGVTVEPGRTVVTWHGVELVWAEVYADSRSAHDKVRRELAWVRGRIEVNGRLSQVAANLRLWRWEVR